MAAIKTPEKSCKCCENCCCAIPAFYGRAAHLFLLVSGILIYSAALIAFTHTDFHGYAWIPEGGVIATLFELFLWFIRPRFCKAKDLCLVFPIIVEILTDLFLYSALYISTIPFYHKITWENATTILPYCEERNQETKNVMEFLVKTCLFFVWIMIFAPILKLFMLQSGFVILGKWDNAATKEMILQAFQGTIPCVGKCPTIRCTKQESTESTSSTIGKCSEMAAQSSLHDEELGDDRQAEKHRSLLSRFVGRKRGDSDEEHRLLFD